LSQNCQPCLHEAITCENAPTRFLHSSSLLLILKQERLKRERLEQASLKEEKRKRDTQLGLERLIEQRRIEQERLEQEILRNQGPCSSYAVTEMLRPDSGSCNPARASRRAEHPVERELGMTFFTGGELRPASLGERRAKLKQVSIDNKVAENVILLVLGFTC
jgi:hypothetical protein